MVAALIKINGVTGSDTDFPISSTATLTNSSNTGVTTWLWEVVSQPTGWTDSLSATNVAAPTFTPTKEGTYLLRLTVNAGTAIEHSNQVVLGVLFLKSGLREPAVGESTEASTSRGWAGPPTAVNDFLREIDTGFKEGPVLACYDASGTLVNGNTVLVLDEGTIKVGLYGEEKVPGAVLLLGSDASALSGTVGVVVAVPGSGLIKVRTCGLIEGYAGVPLVGVPVFVGNAGALSLTEGTYRRRVGVVVYSSAGSYDVWFDGRTPDDEPGLNSITLYDNAATSAPSGEARLRVYSGALEASENGGGWIKFLTMPVFFAGFATMTGGATTFYFANETSDCRAVAVGYPCPRDTMFTKLRVYVTTNNSATAVVFTVYKNGVATAITVSVTALTTGAFTDSSHTASFAEGDRIDLVSTNTAGSGGIILSATLV